MSNNSCTAPTLRARALGLAMPTLEDIRLGQLAVAHGLAQPTEIEECLAEQHRQESQGKPIHLGEILINQQFITRSQLERLLALQQETVQKVTRIGTYDLIRKLGEGGMGAVYQAKDTRSGDLVALKVLPRSRARDTTFLRRFEAEARAAFELDHKNIVQGLDVGHADGYHFLVMEYVDGKDVFTLLEEKGRFSQEEAVNILEQVASALDHIHGERLVHRDLKPENIIVSADGTAKLTDMGLAVDKEAQGRRRITKAGIAMGTPFYLSPEQIQGKSEIDIRSDIYSMGATVYEMVTGKPPFDGETSAVVMMKHLTEQVPSPHEIDRAVSIGFCHILEKMMAKDPAERYQAPSELLEDLDLLHKGEDPKSVRPQAGRSSISRPTRVHGRKSKSRIVKGPPQRKNEYANVNENLDALEPLLRMPGVSSGGSSSRQLASVSRRMSKGNRLRSSIRPAPNTGVSMKWAILAGVAVAAIVTILFLIINVFGSSVPN